MSFAGFYMSPLWALEISGVTFCCPTIKMTPMGHVTKASSGRRNEDITDLSRRNFLVPRLLIRGAWRFWRKPGESWG